MRLPVDARFASLTRIAGAASLALALSSCGSPPPDFARMAKAAQAADPTGPSADFPVVLGEPYTVDGTLYTPEDTLNYDQVGYAALDGQGGEGVSVSHRTLPLPSYVEITSLDSGRTILARVERRGPMTGSRLVALSAGAARQLGIGDGEPVRVRRTVPPEAERAELRRGNSVPERLETPATLVEVLRERLPAAGSASLRMAEASPPSERAPVPAQSRSPEPVAAHANPSSTPSGSAEFAEAFGTRTSPAPLSRSAAANAPQASSAYPLAPLDDMAAPVRTASIAAPSPAAEPVTVQTDAGGRFVVQAAAYSSKASADRAAQRIDGFVMRAGRVWRVRAGPFETRGQAEAALAKVRAAGYRDARVFTNTG